MDLKTLGSVLSDFVHGVVILDGNGIIVWANDYVKGIFSEQEIIKKKFNDIFRVSVLDILKSTSINMTYTEHCYIVKGRRVYEKGLPMDMIFIESIQSFKNKDVKIHCLQSIINSIDDGIIMSDYEGKVVIYNKAMEKIEGVKAKDMLNKYIWDAYKYGIENESEHRKVFHSRKPIIKAYKAHVYNNNIPKYESYNTYPIIKEGEGVGVFSISKNETELKSLLSETVELKRKYIQKGLYRISEKSMTNGTTFTFSDVVGCSETTSNLIKEAQTIALLENNVLIVGDTGTGKEVFAQSIHNFGSKSEEQFIGINCAAIPENLLESILFGAVKGAYTGAIDRTGLFQEAGDGTLFLDELNSMPVSMQTKLLRVLQERKVRKVGDVNNIPINCRVICAINEDPLQLIKAGRLRQDLFYRIAGLILYIPPLRDRREDISELYKFFITKYNRLMNRNITALSEELKKVILSYDWPGNVRELEHTIENLMVRTKENQTELTLSDMPTYLSKVILSSNAIERKRPRTESLTETLRDIEKKLIIESLKNNNWNISKASKSLGIIRQSLIYRMKKLEIEKTDQYV